jgi:hypothetical protein
VRINRDPKCEELKDRATIVIENTTPVVETIAETIEERIERAAGGDISSDGKRSTRYAPTLLSKAIIPNAETVAATINNVGINQKLARKFDQTLDMRVYNEITPY